MAEYDEIFYGGCDELTMAQYEALTSIDNSVDYNITDYPDNAITNTQMTYALTCTRLFNAGEVFTCTDSGTYTKGHTYQITVSGSTKSWTDITPTASVQPLYKHELVIGFVLDSTYQSTITYHYYSNDNTAITSLATIDDKFVIPCLDNASYYGVGVAKLSGSTVTVSGYNRTSGEAVTGEVSQVSDTVSQLI